MKLYLAEDKIDGTDSFFLLYDHGGVAVMLPTYVDTVKRNVRCYALSKPDRISDMINPALLAEWQ